MRSARNLYRLNLALATLGSIGALAGTVVALQRVRFSFGPLRRWLRDCDRFLLPHLTPDRLAVLALGLLGTVALARGVRSLIRQLRAARRLARAVPVLGESEIAHQRVRVIAGTRAQAFCMGLLRPRIYLSRVALERLSWAELAAVIAHEAHHARRRDPLRQAALAVLADSLFFLPGLRRLKQRYQELAELAADEAAVTAVESASVLAAALLRFDGAGPPGTVSLAAERVDHLLGSPPRWKVPISTLTATFATVAGLFVVILLAGSAGQGRSSLAALAMQSCMIAMVLAPMLVLVSLAIVGRRMVATSR